MITILLGQTTNICLFGKNGIFGAFTTLYKSIEVPTRPISIGRNQFLLVFLLSYLFIFNLSSFKINRFYFFQTKPPSLRSISMMFLTFEMRNFQRLSYHCCCYRYFYMGSKSCIGNRFSPFFVALKTGVRVQKTMAAGDSCIRKRCERWLG